jgi:hypothetical protein
LLLIELSAHHPLGTSIGKRDLIAMWRLKDMAGSGNCQKTSEVPVLDEHALQTELRRLADLEPRVIGIELSTSENLQIGLGGPWAFVEHVVDEPWKAEVAISRTSYTGQKSESVSFVCGGQDSEIPSRYLFPVTEAVEVLVECFRGNEGVVRQECWSLFIGPPRGRNENSLALAILIQSADTSNLKCVFN